MTLIHSSNSINLRSIDLRQQTNTAQHGAIGGITPENAFFALTPIHNWLREELLVLEMVGIDPVTVKLRSEKRHFDLSSF